MNKCQLLIENLKTLLETDFPKFLKDEYDIADHITNHSSSPVSHEQMVDYFKGAKAELKHTPVENLSAGDTDTNKPSKTKQKKYSKLSSETRPPIVIENGTVVDGNHRYRDAVARGESHIWAYHVMDK